LQSLEGKVIYFNRVPHDTRDSAWGGGNIFLHSLVEAVKAEGAEVIFVSPEKADMCYVHDCRSASDAIISGKPMVLRVGDLGTHGKPEIMKMLIETIAYSNHTVFPSTWAYKYAYFNNSFRQNCGQSPVTIIHNQPDTEYFKRKPVHVITHHWSDNPRKGKETYEALQEKQPEWKFSFTFIGRPCFKVKYPTRLIKPSSKDIIAKLLPTADYYLTASQEEAGANHVLEALACNLPVLYKRGGGSIEEYCGIQGIPFSTVEQLEPILNINYFPGVKDACQKMLSVFKSVLTI